MPTHLFVIITNSVNKMLFDINLMAAKNSLEANLNTEEKNDFNYSIESKVL